MDIREQLERIEEREQAQKLERLKAEHDFKTVLATVEGRRFVQRILETCAVYQSTFDSDVATMAYREGRRSIGLWVNEMFYSCPETYIQMITEKANDERNNPD